MVIRWLSLIVFFHVYFLSVIIASKSVSLLSHELPIVLKREGSWISWHVRKLYLYSVHIINIIYGLAFHELKSDLAEVSIKERANISKWFRNVVVVREPIKKHEFLANIRNELHHVWLRHEFKQSTWNVNHRSWRSQKNSNLYFGIKIFWHQWCSSH